MKKLVILGGGTGGTIMANRMRHNLDLSEWEITVIDREQPHYYQPGFLFLPFGSYTRNDVIKPKKNLIPPGINFIIQQVTDIHPEKNQVVVSDGSAFRYDFLIIATGSRIVPSETPGLPGPLWYKNIFDFYTPEGALALAGFFQSWQGGELVLNIADMPIKCPVAPLEFVFYADAFFTEHGFRNKVNISYVTPLSGAFTKPEASRMLGALLEKKNIRIIPDFYLERVDNEKKTLVSYDEREVPFYVLVTIPVHKGDEVIEKSGLGDEMGFVKADKHSLVSVNYPNVFVLGDAGNFPTSKAGSVVHFQAEILEKNLICAMEQRPFTASYDGHSNCYIETGFRKGALIDFNYDTEPLPGKFPLPWVGPFGLLKETRLNHYGKLMFRWIYWHLLLKGRWIPVSTNLSLKGKKIKS